MRVLQVVTKMDRGGLETMLMNYYRRLMMMRLSCLAEKYTVYLALCHGVSHI